MSKSSSWRPVGKSSRVCIAVGLQPSHKPGFPSAIELSRANPSVATLQHQAATYNITVLEFLDIPRHKRRLIPSESGVEMELLSIGTKMLECMFFRVPPKSGSDGSYSHVGEEFIYILKGSLEFWLEELESHMLQEGDSFGSKATWGTAGLIQTTKKWY